MNNTKLKGPYRLAPGVARLGLVPERDLPLSQLPAEQHRSTVQHRWKIHQPRLEPFELHTGFLDLVYENVEPLELLDQFAGGLAATVSR